MQDTFIDEYIQKCLDDNVVTPAEMCDLALLRIDKINKIIKEDNKLRVELKNLEGVLRYFNHDSVKKTKKRNIPTINPEVANSELDEEYFDLVSNICKFVSDNKNGVTPRDIMDHLGNIEKNENVYVAIKWLCERGYLKRNNDRSLCPGEKWEEAPH